jgi:hypothetical protein
MAPKERGALWVNVESSFYSPLATLPYLHLKKLGPRGQGTAN